MPFWEEVGINKTQKVLNPGQGFQNWIGSVPSCLGGVGVWVRQVWQARASW